MLRFLSPLAQEIRDSPITPREFELRLHERVEPRLSPLSAWTTRYLTSRKPFYGVFKKRRFSLQRRSLFWIWSQPIAYGEMTPLPLGAGVRIHLTWRPHPGTRLLQWTCLGAFAATAYRGLDPRIVAVPLVIAIALPIAFRLELPGARKALENFLRPG